MKEIKVSTIYAILNKIWRNKWGNNKKILHMYACRWQSVVMILQNQVKYFLIQKFFCNSKNNEQIYFLWSTHCTLYFCLFGALVPTSVACLYYQIGMLNAGVACNCCCCVWIAQFLFIFSVLLIVNVLFVDVSVGVVSNLRTYVLSMYMQQHQNQFEYEWDKSNQPIQSINKTTISSFTSKCVSKMWSKKEKNKESLISILIS